MRDIATIRTGYYYFWLAMICLLLAISMNEDLTGGGLHQGMYFRALGEGLYFLYYPGLVFLIFHFFWRLKSKNSVLSLSDDLQCLKVYSKNFKVDEIVEVRNTRYLFIFRTLTISTRDRNYYIKSFAVKESIDGIENEIRRWHSLFLK